LLRLALLLPLRATVAIDCCRMAPSKFDDLCKPAKDVLTDDYQEKGYVFKAKAKTNFEGVGSLLGSESDGKSGGVLTTQVDIDLKAKEMATPAKLTWKLPKPLGIAGIAFDKLEMAKDGKMKLEASVDKGLHGVSDLKLECKSDLASTSNIVVGGTYTGIAGALCKVEFKAMDPADYTAEAGYALGHGATVSVKSSKASVVDVGAQYANGPLTCSATAKCISKAFTFHGLYKANDDLKVACTYDFGGKTNGAFAAGLGYNAAPGTSIKSKLTGVNGADLAVSTSVKKELAKGATVTAGAKFPIDGAKPWTYGIQFNIE